MQCSICFIRWLHSSNEQTRWQGKYQLPVLWKRRPTGFDWHVMRVIPPKVMFLVLICFLVSFAGTVTRFFSLSNLTYQCRYTHCVEEWQEPNATSRGEKGFSQAASCSKPRFFFSGALSKKNKLRTTQRRPTGRDVENRPMLQNSKWSSQAGHFWERFSLSARLDQRIHVRKPWSAPLVRGEVRCEKLEFFELRRRVRCVSAVDVCAVCLKTTYFQLFCGLVFSLPWYRQQRHSHVWTPTGHRGARGHGRDAVSRARWRGLFLWSGLLQFLGPTPPQLPIFTESCRRWKQCWATDHPKTTGATLHDGLMETFPVGESCCERISTLQSRGGPVAAGCGRHLITTRPESKSRARDGSPERFCNRKPACRTFRDCNRISSNSLFTWTRRPDMADVTALRSDLAQKASTQSITQLQSQVDVVQDAVRQKASLQNLSRLEGVVRVKASVGDAASKVNETALKSVRAHLVSAEAQLRQKANETALESVRAQLVAAEAQLRQKAAASSTPRFADLPVTPNMMKDTKHFHSVCHGRVGGGDSLGGCLGIAVGVLQLSRYCRRCCTQHREGRGHDVAGECRPCWTLTAGRPQCEWGWSAPKRFLTAPMWGHCCSLCWLCPPRPRVHEVFLSRDCDKYTSSYVGSFTTEVGVFVNVLEHTGNIWMHFAGNFGAGVKIAGPASQGWQYLHNSKAGWGLWQESEILGERRVRVAIALPYQSFGNHSNVPVWAGFDPNFFRCDVWLCAVWGFTGGLGHFFEWAGIALVRGAMRTKVSKTLSGVRHLEFFFFSNMRWGT